VPNLARMKLFFFLSGDEPKALGGDGGDFGVVEIGVVSSLFGI